MKSYKLLSIIISFLFQLSLNDNRLLKDLSPLYEEINGCFNYFMDTTNFIEGSKGYGLTQDRLTDPTLSSIAATGFLLASYPVFVEIKLIEYEYAKNIVNKTYDTILNIQSDSKTSYAGCLSHFVNKYTGERVDNSEISTIYTVILISGIISR